MSRYKLDTENSGNDEILVGDSIAEVTQDVLNFHEIHQLPEGWTIELIDEQSSDMPPPATAPFSVQWEFMGSATQEHFDAAQAVADAMQIYGTTDTTKDVIAKACQILGNDWDHQSVLAMIENCTFSRIS
jgi:hypothetical protein